MFLFKVRIKKYFLPSLFVLLISCSSPENKTPMVATDFCANIHRNDSIKLSIELQSVSDSMINKTGVYVLEDGGESLVTRAWLCEYAEKTIDVQYFIFSDDNVGLIACDYMVRAADRGVKLRVLVDDIMVEASVHDLLMLDSHENISIKIYNPGVNLGKNIFKKIGNYSTNFQSSNQRMHNKTFTVDGKISITGGRNIADEYFDYDHEYNFRDRDVLLIGKTANTIQISFDDFWNSALSVPVKELVNADSNDFKDNNRFEALHQYACNPENFWPQVRERIKNFPSAIETIKNSGKFLWLDSVYFVTDVPGKNDGTKGLAGGGVTTDTLISLIRNAKTSIAIQSPYLITTELGQNLFRETVARGVKVRILTNSLASTDNLEAFSGYQRDRKKLLETGVEIFEFRPDAAERYSIMTGALQQKINFTPIFGLHAKSMVIDGKITVIGTFNLDPRSANLNTECFAIIYSEPIANAVLNCMEQEFQPENSWHTTLSWNPDEKAGMKKRVKTMTRRVLPKSIL